MKKMYAVVVGASLRIGLLLSIFAVGDMCSCMPDVVSVKRSVVDTDTTSAVTRIQGMDVPTRDNPLLRVRYTNQLTIDKTIRVDSAYKVIPTNEGCLAGSGTLSLAAIGALLLRSERPAIIWTGLGMMASPLLLLGAAFVRSLVIHRKVLFEHDYARSNPRLRYDVRWRSGRRTGVATEEGAFTALDLGKDIASIKGPDTSYSVAIRGANSDSSAVQFPLSVLASWDPAIMGPGCAARLTDYEYTMFLYALDHASTVLQQRLTLASNTDTYYDFLSLPLYEQVWYVRKAAKDLAYQHAAQAAILQQLMPALPASAIEKITY